MGVTFFLSKRAFTKAHLPKFNIIFFYQRAREKSNNNLKCSTSMVSFSTRNKQFLIITNETKFTLSSFSSKSWREPSPGLSCDQNRPVSLSPVEMGVVWSKAGPVASGTVITGLAAGLKPRVVNWPTNDPVKRYLTCDEALFALYSRCFYWITFSNCHNKNSCLKNFNKFY